MARQRVSSDQQISPQDRCGAPVLHLLYGGIVEEEAASWRAARMKLLPHNRWFIERVQEARRVLGLPRRGVSGLDLRRFPRQGTQFKDIPRISRTSLGHYWMDVHQAKARGEPVPRRVLPPGFPRWFRRYLNTRAPLLHMEPSQLPGWMQGAPPNLGMSLRLQDVEFDERVPLDKLAALLAGAFRLPWGSFPKVRLFVVTGDKSLLNWEEPLEVLVTGMDPYARQVLQVTVRGVDAWTTKEQWSQVFDRHIRPIQESQRMALGERPANRRSTWFPDDSDLEFYELVRHQRLSYDGALHQISQVPGWESANRNRGIAVVKKLDALMKPAF